MLYTHFPADFDIIDICTLGLLHSDTMQIRAIHLRRQFFERYTLPGHDSAAEVERMDRLEDEVIVRQLELSRRTGF